MKIGKQMTDQNKITPINCHTFILDRDPPCCYHFPYFRWHWLEDPCMKPIGLKARLYHL
jgi:hypothetical protein